MSRPHPHSEVRPEKVRGGLRDDERCDWRKSTAECADARKLVTGLISHLTERMEFMRRRVKDTGVAAVKDLLTVSKSSCWLSMGARQAQQKVLHGALPFCEVRQAAWL